MIAAEQGFKIVRRRMNAPCAILLNTANFTVRVPPIVALSLLLFDCHSGWPQAREA